MKLFDQKVDEPFRALANFEYTCKDTLAGRKPIIIADSLSINEDIYLSDQEILRSFCYHWIIETDDLGNLLNNMEVRFIIFNIGLEHI